MPDVEHVGLNIIKYDKRKYTFCIQNLDREAKPIMSVHIADNHVKVFRFPRHSVAVDWSGFGRLLRLLVVLFPDLPNEAGKLGFKNVSGRYPHYVWPPWPPSDGENSTAIRTFMLQRMLTSASYN